ncbi:MAG: FAD-dependent 5-carboxymethylaminomethyl-2-thiouridine(34) oxidoreductase MnmC [Psychrobacter sp.]|uniref:FAD-dependent 5-carboxymethylaminomethyl-2-thiouridine(34) oxidoreductase MnmC n=1 Tax=unclassified Psychrobacter TaxID=196806 RepID=UPI001787CB5C|nr:MULTISPECIES: FAD-dependent 5-carboxymethylaminomethyl-2-thiouridine(34) oxidoreductase MnmC [unclassified Psychrobacter]MBE0443186.1 FAD-dependent 5-carboxymethylaminomethyl-2-thiouridine(34) oxidoreductase MnmC [Psychrobacter sp. FME13]
MPNSISASKETCNAPTSAQNANSLNIITPAKIDWQLDDTGKPVPVSGEFGDVYFSHADGLAETRHVFLTHNKLPERLAMLNPKQCFTIAELGFGTGLNLLATWELWRQLRQAHPHLATARLHFITTEKFPIPLTDLTQILALWQQRAPELAAPISQLLATYPPLIAGCHRLNFYDDNLTVDMWFGDAAESLGKLANKLATQLANAPAPYVDAWFLDGFAPSCNETLWAKDIFAQVQRLSHPTTTAATYSCAGIVKRGLKEHGFEINKVKGFGRKKQMLTAVMTDAIESDEPHSNYTNHPDGTCHIPSHSAVIGAGVSGLLTAWSLANRGIQVTLLDKSAPLAGASGNPRALLAPKMTPIHHVDEHLHTIGYLYSTQLYQLLNKQAIKEKTAPILEPTGALDLLIKANIGTAQIADYPNPMATTLSNEQAKKTAGLIEQDLSENLYLPQSGLVNPQALKDIILTHPLISFQQVTVHEMSEADDEVGIKGHNQHKESISIAADNVIVCAAFESHQLDKRIFDCRKIRGQLSWFTPTPEQYAKLPKTPLKYSGYCTPFTAQVGDDGLNNVETGQPQFLLGASFIRNDIDTKIRMDEHQISRDKLITAIPEMEAIIPTDMSGWQGRAGVRTQTPDYHPIVGQLNDSRRIWVVNAMGAKGYAIAPLCAEALADMMIGTFSPLSAAMLARLSPNRRRLQAPLT